MTLSPGIHDVFIILGIVMSVQDPDVVTRVSRMYCAWTCITSEREVSVLCFMLD